MYTRELLGALFALPEATAHEWVLFFNSASLGGRHAHRMNELKQLWPYAQVRWSVHYWPSKLFTAATMLASQPSTRWMFRGDVDLVFIPNMLFYPLRDRTPTVVTVHDLSFERYPECLDFKGLWRHRALQPRRFVRHARHVIAVSDHTKQDIQALYDVPTDQITRVYPGVTHAHSMSIASTQEQEHIISDIPQTYLLTLSTIEPRKNMDTLLDAFERVHANRPDLFLIVAGAPAWKSRATLKRLQRMSGVRYVGYVDDATKQQLLRGASLFMYPSFYEGFGFPPLEAQRYGVPVIAGSHSSLSEVLGNSALFIDVLDTHSVERAITHLLTDSALVQRYRERGNENVKRFEWARAARETLSVLTSL